MLFGHQGNRIRLTGPPGVPVGEDLLVAEAAKCATTARAGHLDHPLAADHQAALVAASAPVVRRALEYERTRKQR